MLSEETYKEIHRIWTSEDPIKAIYNGSCGFDFFMALEVGIELENRGIIQKDNNIEKMKEPVEILIRKMLEICDGKHGSRYLLDRALKELQIEAKMKLMKGDFE